MQNRWTERNGFWPLPQHPHTFRRSSYQCIEWINCRLNWLNTYLALSLCRSPKPLNSRSSATKWQSFTHWINGFHQIPTFSALIWTHGTQLNEYISISFNFNPINKCFLQKLKQNIWHKNDKKLQKITKPMIRSKRALRTLSTNQMAFYQSFKKYYQQIKRYLFKVWLHSRIWITLYLNEF